MESMDFNLFESFKLKLETTELKTTEVEAVELETDNKTSNFILTFPQNFLDL